MAGGRGLCSGLQSRGRRFNSGLSLNRPGGEIGRRKGLKTSKLIPCRFDSGPGHQIAQTMSKEDARAGCTWQLFKGQPKATTAYLTFLLYLPFLWHCHLIVVTSVMDGFSAAIIPNCSSAPTFYYFTSGNIKISTVYRTNHSAEHIHTVEPKYPPMDYLN